MRLNTLKPAVGSKQKMVRVGRGMGSGLGKTCGRGHKGAKARSGYSRKIDFEGGQLPLQRRLPKFGFSPLLGNETVEVRLRDLNKVKAARIDLAELKKANLIGNDVKRVKVILNGEIKKAVTLVGIKATAGASKAIETAGGKIEQLAAAVAY
jgi:ribosomal protein L15, bacterial/organelle